MILIFFYVTMYYDNNKILKKIIFLQIRPKTRTCDEHSFEILHNFS